MADSSGHWLSHSREPDSRAVPDLGRLLREYRAAERLTQEQLASRLVVSQSYVSRIEAGRRVPLHVEFLRAVSELLGIPPAQLGLASGQPAPPGSRPPGGARVPDLVAASQDEWRTVRRYLNQHRCDLAREAAHLYDAATRLPDTPLLALPGWRPGEPVLLDHIELTMTDGPHPCGVDGSEPESWQVRPLRAPGQRYERYTSAVRYLDPPTLFENRPSYRLLDVGWAQGTGSMRFGLGNYFDKLDVSEAAGHEMAAASLDRTIGSTGVPGVEARSALPFRALVGDPFDLTRRAVIPAITTLTLRRRHTHGTASFLLHWRDPAKVATASGLYDVIPAGEFQPSSMAPWDRENDFDLWRNVVRELSEELLGTPEHDGSRSTPIDYAAWPLFRNLGQAREERKLSVYCLGVAIDALTLAATIMTVLVIDDDAFDAIFGDVVHVNAEGVTVAAGPGRRAADGLPFTEATVTRLLRSEPMASPGAGCLALAWRHRVQLLGA